MVKLGPGLFERLADFLKHNRAKFRRVLALISLKNDRESLVSIVNKMIKNEYLNGYSNLWAPVHSSIQESTIENPRANLLDAYGSTQGPDQQAMPSILGNPLPDLNIQSSERGHPLYRSAAFGDASNPLPKLSGVQLDNGEATQAEKKSRSPEI